MNRRFFLALTAAGVSGAARAWPQTGAVQLAPQAEPYFRDWLGRFYVTALAAGISRTLLDRELAGLAPDPRVAADDAVQPEFARPVGAYVQGAMSSGRIAEGRLKRDQVPAFSRIEANWGVPREVLIGVWAMESGFGARQGDMDVVRSLATLAQGRRRDWAEIQLIAALRMIASGDVVRGQLRGSWAGAMGQTQVLPTVYLESAVTASGEGRPDIWNSAGDALATAAHLLQKDGWRRGESWAVEVILPSGFDYGLSESETRPFAWWADRGVRRSPTASWRTADADAPGVLLLPSGAAGPAFLALPNHFAIRGYNNSIAYALTVGLLADRFAGGVGLATRWPYEVALTLDQRMTAQTALSRLGFDPGTADGMIGFGTRRALRAWQKREGLPADGYLTPQLVQRLSAAASRA
jgi:lytic murein transglycosylase